MNGLKSYNARFRDLQGTHCHSTRFYLGGNLMNLPIVRSSKFLNSFLIQSVKFWNEVAAELKAAPNLNLFRKELRNNFFYRNL